MGDESNVSTAGMLVPANEDSIINTTSTPKPKGSKPIPNNQKKSVVMKKSTKRKATQSNMPSIMPPSKKKTAGQLQVSQSESGLKLDRAALDTAVAILRGKVQRAGEDNNGHELYKIDGLKTPMRDYQIVASAFMIRHERSQQGPQGGIIADEMGIGKILEAMGCMVSNRPSKKDRNEHRGITLIVAPSRHLCAQWHDEFKKHTSEDSESIEIYQGGSKSRVRAMWGFDYILTTYKQVLSDYDHMSNGVLFKIEFNRIILDEGHGIKNRSAKTSKACRALKGSRKWILSGTPFHNAEKEALPYLDFLGANIKSHRVDFENCFGRLDEDDVHNRIMKVLELHMIRREKGEYFLGREICPLPPRKELIITYELTPQERIIYDCCEEITANKLSDTEAEAFPNSSRNQLDMCKFLTRMRQAVNHPFLLETFVRALTPEDLDRLKKKLLDDGTNNFNGIIQYIDQEISSKDNMGCIECQETSRLIVIVCGHLICYDCYDGIVAEDIDDGKRVFKCPECGEKVDSINYNSDESDDDEDDTKTIGDNKDAVKTSGNRHGRVIRGKNGWKMETTPLGELELRRPGDDANGEQPKSNRFVTRWLRKCDATPGKIQSSSKVNKTMDLISEWQSEAPDDKVIVYNKWTVTAKILGRMLNAKNIPFLYYWGDMSCAARRDALEEFRTNQSIKVLLASLTAGSAGLNIECANRVISLDPWWNVCVEEQAFGRVWRHGQEKASYLVRIIAKDTVDERMLQMQEDKAAQCSEAIKQGKKPKPLSKEETMFLLFGNREDSSDDMKDEDEDDDSEYED
ncbi:P-loop containing nucleoside triphosphate hydrolase protein [Biscogniauxia mediterranea]|nr:P-loop containing nucleoside triphosphate hydrolase protein [Biscogniauxia mediterranea]